MDERRRELLEELAHYYRSCGVEHADDETIRAEGVGGVTWIGMAVVRHDLSADDFAVRLLELSDVRMNGDGARCPFELLPDVDCVDELRSLVARLRLGERVSIYSLAA
jgi:hypothetical protein